jgi:cytochrome P450
MERGAHLARAAGREDGRGAAGLPPGPRRASIGLTLRYVWRFPELLAELHGRFGPSFTLRLPGLPPTVVTADRGLVRHLLTGDPLTRRHANDLLKPVLGEGTVIVLEPAPHLARRRMLLPPFHGERVRGYAGLIEKAMHDDLDTWPADRPVRVLDHTRRITLAVIQSAVLGHEDEAFSRELAHLVDTLDSPFANFGFFAPAISRRAKWNVLAEPFHRKVDQLDALMARAIAATRADPGLAERTDVLAMLLQALDEDGAGLTDRELNDELKTLLIAGHETTATAIAWAADLLAHRPAAAAAIRAGDRDHLSAAAKEVMRLRTVVPISAGRRLLEPAAAGEHVLPAGTEVIVDAYTLHHDPELHPQPDEFRPERFLGEGPPPYSYLPFGGGAHRCLGATLASLELEIALKAIVERFDLEPVGPPERPGRRGVTHVPARGATVRARRRA